jgi:hypothetical protein
VARYEPRFGEHGFDARVADGRLELARGRADRADATIETDPATLSALLWHGWPLAEALQRGEITIAGSRPAVRLFLGLFPLPSRAGTTSAAGPPRRRRARCAKIQATRQELLAVTGGEA